MRPYVILVALLLAGCVTPTEGDRQLMHQNQQAGDLIASREDAPMDVRAAGEVVSLNSAALMENLGAPEEPKAYSKEQSAILREKAKQEHKEPPAFLKWIIDTASPLVPWGGVAGSVILGAWGIGQKIAKSGAVKKLKAVYAGVDAIKKEVGEGKYADAVTNVMRKVAGLHNVYNDIKADLKEFRA
jgi:hypothetical protein